MFDIGIQELIVIFVIVLVVFGPEKLPEIAKVLGRGIGDLQRTLRSAKDELDSEVTKVKDEVKDELKDPIALKNELFSSNDLFTADSVEKKAVEEHTESFTEIDSAAESADTTELVYQDQGDVSHMTDKQRVLQQLNKSLKGTRNV